MLELRDLRVRYGTHEAVAGLDLVVDGSVALLGANGAGKTSVLRAVSGLAPATGSVVFDGRQLLGRAPEAIARAGVLHVPEGRRVVPTLDVHENLLLGELARAGRDPLWTVADVYDLFPLLTRLRDRPGYALSGGEQQMVAVGRALVGAPRVLLLDEPSLGLAPSVAQVVFDVLAVAAETIPVLLVEQNHDLAAGLCPRAVVLAHGDVTLAGPTAGLGRAELMAAYLGRAPV
ncbi:MAG TPA: ATP-binding cassette domain-containing protein [Iamia sp.]|nr:ATP-binding cassette domain-containing protein [Iamia sp.]